MRLQSVENAMQDYRSPIHPREALRGGRTEGFWMLKSVGDSPQVRLSNDARDPFFATHAHPSGKEIKFADVVSLYPSVMLQNAFVAEHPSIYRGPTHDYITQLEKRRYTGLIRCAVLPSHKSTQ